MKTQSQGSGRPSRRVKKLSRALALVDGYDPASVGQVVAQVDPRASEDLVTAALLDQALEVEWQLKWFTVDAALRLQRRAVSLEKELARRGQSKLRLVS